MRMRRIDSKESDDMQAVVSPLRPRIKKIISPTSHSNLCFLRGNEDNSVRYLVDSKSKEVVLSDLRRNASIDRFQKSTICRNSSTESLSPQQHFRNRLSQSPTQNKDLHLLMSSEQKPEVKKYTLPSIKSREVPKQEDNYFLKNDLVALSSIST